MTETNNRKSANDILSTMQEKLRDTRTPSRVTEDFWVHWLAYRDYPVHTERGGKWLVFVPLIHIDAVWEKVKALLEDDRLGLSAKCATAKRNPNAGNSDAGVICIYTYDADDKEDVMRIRQALTDGEVTNPNRKIPYKLDSDTHLGRYRKNGDKRVSAYYE